MDPRTNPYAPGAGTPPPALVGRDEQIETFDILLERLENGYLRAQGRADDTMNLGGIKVSSLEIERTPALQTLHENVLEQMTEFFRYEVKPDMVNAENVAETTLQWIAGYRDNSAYENFRPHITLGYGQAEQIDRPIRFRPQRLALCHLGNHCTCTRILTSVDIEQGR